MDSITELRNEIDQIHEDLYALLLRRRDVALKIWKIKKDQGLPLIVPEREQAIINQFLAHEDSELDPEFREALRGIMSSLLSEFQKYLLSKHDSL